MRTGTIDEILETVMQQSDYVETRMLYDCHKDPLEGYKELWSIRQEGTIGIVSDDYATVQNIEAITPFMMALKSLPGGESRQYKYNMREAVGRFRLELHDPNMVITPTDGKPIMQGYALGNSFDTSQSVFLESILMRLICSNGMTMKQSMGGVRIKHIGMKSDVMAALRQYINEMGNKMPDALSMINEADATPMISGSPRKILYDLGFTQKAAREILRQEHNFGNMYDLYNAVSYYASHEQENFMTVQTLERAETMLIEARTIQRRVEKTDVPKDWAEDR